MRDLPALNYKYEPSQEWGLVREYRERAMARRLDRDGTQLENALKIINVTPVAATVAVQSWPTVTVWKIKTMTKF